VSVSDGERIASRAIARAEVAFEVHAPELIRCRHLRNGSEYGVVRRFLCFGLVNPARWSMLPNVLAAGQSTPGSNCSNLALSFRAPQDGYLLRNARIAFSVLSGVAWEQL